MSDLLLEEMFKPERWSYYIQKGVDKRLNRAGLKALCNTDVRVRLYLAIKNDNYLISPPRQQKIPKDNGEYRIVYINSDIDRIFLSIANDLLFEFCGSLVHKRCMSYQKNLSCGKVVTEAVQTIKNIKTNVIGLKADLSKYFDSVPIEFIDEMFDKVENIVGKSKVIDILRKYYHQNLCFDFTGELVEHYQSLKQGCATASFLADALLYELDEHFSKKLKFYVRYSDDLLLIDNRTEENYNELETMLSSKGLKLNPKKVETLTKDKFFKFLGFSIRGSEISLSKNRIKTFQKEIEKRTIKSKKTYIGALNDINNYLYGSRSNIHFCWSTSVLSVINVEADIHTLNEFVMDCLRAVSTGKKKVGGLGYEISKKVGVITRGIGRNVTNNRKVTEKELVGYKTLMCMRKALQTSRSLFDTLVRAM